jgi:alpha-beta hydrolase superfamily lysophospholipase
LTTPSVPVVFIHGLWLHATSWESWIDRFAAAGYAPVAPGWPGVPDTVELARANPAPGKPLFEAAAANFSLHSPAKVNTANSDRGPLLLIMGGRDHTVPEAITKSTLKQYRGSDAVTDLVEFADRGHSLTIDSGWNAVADECLSWLAAPRRAGEPGV